MPKQKILGGLDVVKILEVFGFSVFKQKGSHIRLQRIVAGAYQNITVPNHKEIRKGTLKAIYN